MLIPSFLFILLPSLLHKHSRRWQQQHHHQHHHHPFTHQVTEWLDNQRFPWIDCVADDNNNNGPRLLSISDHVKLHIIPTTPRSPALTKSLTDTFIHDTIIHLHQDVWETQFGIVQARLYQKLSLGILGGSGGNAVATSVSVVAAAPDPDPARHTHQSSQLSQQIMTRTVLPSSSSSGPQLWQNDDTNNYHHDNSNDHHDHAMSKPQPPPDQTSKRIYPRLRLRSIGARQTTVHRISFPEADAFLRHHHLWGSPSSISSTSSTNASPKKNHGSSYYYYGLLFQSQLVAVAAFSARRKILRKGQPYRSFELVRYCSSTSFNTDDNKNNNNDNNTATTTDAVNDKDNVVTVVTVMGGISKLLKAFIRNHSPDDIVTIIDRDWGTGEGWYGLGFHLCQVLPPSLWVVETNTKVRTTLVGKQQRIPSSLPFLSDLETNPTEETLARYGYVAIYGAGMERLFMICNRTTAATTAANDHDHTIMDVQDLWDHSIPTYPKSYYSDHPGVAAMLQQAEQMC